MRRIIAVTAGLAVTATSAVVMTTPAGATPTADQSQVHGSAATPSDEKLDEHETQRRTERARGLEKVLRGKAKATGKNKVVKLGKNQFVELAREGEDNVLVVLSEFPDLKHNQITTIWNENFDQNFYQNDLFGEDNPHSMRNFFIEQSSGRFAVKGDVTEWGTLDQPAAFYGANTCAQLDCGGAMKFIEGSLQNLSESKPTAELNEYLSAFDLRDLADYDGDGNFNEPDGYIDNYVGVFAGESEALGGGVLGKDAIWPHTGFLFDFLTFGKGPTVDGTLNPLGGRQIPGTNFWVRNYTLQAENSGVGVFAHEYAHALGLPDHYDTSGSSSRIENSTGFWTLMSVGSYGRVGTQGIGTKAMSLGAWEKLQLGWLDYETVDAGQEATLKLGPSISSNRNAKQAALVNLPDAEVPYTVGAPEQGESVYFSGNDDNADRTMTTTVTVPEGAARLSARIKFQLQSSYDYVYVTVNGTPIDNNRDRSYNPNGLDLGHGISGGVSRWSDLTADLSAYAGQTVELGFRYVSDGAETSDGFVIDQIAINGEVIGDAETDAGWELNGWLRTDGTWTRYFYNAYILENRQYVGSDVALKNSPFTPGWRPEQTARLDFFPYQDGLLIWYWNTMYFTNNTSVNPGGLVLPVDAHPQIEHLANGDTMRARIQMYDATFGTQRTDAITVHDGGVPTTIASKPAQPVFDDTKTWWYGEDEHSVDGVHPGGYQPGWNSVGVPKTGTTVRVVNQNAHGVMNIHVNK